MEDTPLKTNKDEAGLINSLRESSTHKKAVIMQQADAPVKLIKSFQRLETGHSLKKRSCSCAL